MIAADNTFKSMVRPLADTDPQDADGRIVADADPVDQRRNDAVGELATNAVNAVPITTA